MREIKATSSNTLFEDRPVIWDYGLIFSIPDKGVEFEVNSVRLIASKNDRKSFRYNGQLRPSDLKTSLMKIKVGDNYGYTTHIAWCPKEYPDEKKRVYNIRTYYEDETEMYTLWID